MKFKRVLFAIFLFSICGVILWISLRGGHSELDALIPSDRCVKSAYNDEFKKNRISINCQNHNKEVYTIILRKFENKEKEENVLANLKNGIKVRDFLCSNFANPASAISENNINALHVCFSEKIP